MARRSQTTVVVLALTLLLLCAGLSLWFLVLEPAREDDEAAALADAVEPVMGGVRNVLDRINPLLGSRADAVGASLQAQVPAETQDRAGFIGACMAIFANESGFYPNIYNYYDGEKYQKAYYPDGPTEKAHAAGVAQHIKPYWSARGLSLGNVFDLDANVGASIKYLNLPHWSRIMSACGGASLRMRAALLYLGHGAGGKAMDAGLSLGSSEDWTQVVAASLAGSPAKKGDPRRMRMWSVAANAQHYADKYGSPG